MIMMKDIKEPKIGERVQICFEVYEVVDNPDNTCMDCDLMLWRDDDCPHINICDCNCRSDGKNVKFKLLYHWKPLSDLLDALRQVAEDYPGRTVENIIANIESRIKEEERNNDQAHKPHHS